MQHVLRAFTPADTDAVIALWESCGLVRPWNDPRRDIARKLTVQPELFLVAEPMDPEPASAGAEPAERTIVGAGMAGFDGHRGWVNYLAVRPDLQGSGLGRALMAEFERGDLGSHGGPPPKARNTIAQALTASSATVPQPAARKVEPMVKA